MTPAEIQAVKEIAENPNASEDDLALVRDIMSDPDWVTAVKWQMPEVREAENRRLKERLHNYARGGRGWPISDRVNALSEAFVVSCTGGRLSADHHPMVREILQDGPLSLMGLVDGVAQAVGRPLRYGSPAEILAFGSTVPQLPSAVEDAARAVLRARQSPVLSDLLSVTADVRVNTYAPEGFGTVDFAVDMPDEASGKYFLGLVPKFAAQSIQTHSTFGKLVLTLQSTANSDPNFLPTAVAAFATATARAEARALAGVLETNALPDGTALFDAGNSNIGTATLTQAGLGTAMALIRSQPTETGAKSGLPTAAVVIHPDDEAATLALVDTLPPARQPTVVVNAALSSSSYWYVVADPMSAPALARVLMVGADPSGISFGGLSPASWQDAVGKVHDYPGISLDVTHSSAILAVSPVGIARLSKT